jgi:hypothetical protein
MNLVETEIFSLNIWEKEFGLFDRNMKLTKIKTIFVLYIVWLIRGKNRYHFISSVTDTVPISIYLSADLPFFYSPYAISIVTSWPLRWPVVHCVSLLYKRVLYCEGRTFWRYEVVDKHHTEGSGKATPPVCRYRYQ